MSSKQELSASQISQLFKLQESDPKLFLQLQGLLGISDQDAETPAPEDNRRTEDNVPAPGHGTRIDGMIRKQQINAITPTPVTQASDFLATMHDYAMIRRVRQKENYYIPNASRMMHTLNEMDKLIIRKFKARRAAMMMLPMKHVEYFAILWSIQTARCLDYCGYLEAQEDKDFLRFFLDKYPPETIPIPGPLLPFFKSVTTYRHENPLFKRISPGFPSSSLRPQAGSNQIQHNMSNIIFPSVPVIVDITHRYMKAIFGNDLDADGKTAAGNIKNTKAKFPFSDDRTTPAEYSSDLTIGGYKFVKAHASWSDSTAAALSTPGLVYPIRHNADILSNVSQVVEDWANPNASESEYVTDNLQSWLRMTKTNFFTNYLSPMAEYSALWVGSGTLADCNVDGPATGAYVFAYSDSETAPTRADYPFAPSSIFDLNGHVYTTVSTPQPVDERLSAFTQVHASLAANHWYTLPNTARRNGNVWDIRPIYGPSVEITSATTVSTALEKFIEPRVAK